MESLSRSELHIENTHPQAQNGGSLGEEEPGGTNLKLKISQVFKFLAFITFLCHLVWCIFVFFLKFIITYWINSLKIWLLWIHIPPVVVFFQGTWNVFCCSRRVHLNCWPGCSSDTHSNLFIFWWFYWVCEV